MNNKSYFKFSSLLFLIIAIVHLARLIYGWEVVLGETMIPVWASWVAVIVGAYMAWQGYKHGKR